jgi:drug/metabolite transporter (DMT)-like permease
MKKAFLQLHIAVFLAGFTAVLGKLIKLNEGLLVWYRLLFTVIVMAVILFYKKEFIRMPLKSVLKMVGVGAVIAFHWVTFYGSVKYGNISVALVCLSSAGFFSALLEPLFLQKPIVFQEVLLGMLAVVGIYIIFDFHPQFKLGIFYGVLGALGAAIFPIFNKQLVKEFSPRTLTFYELAGGLLVLTLILPVYLNYSVATYYIPTLKDFYWLLILAVVCTVYCFDLQLKALQKISAFTCNLTYNLEPVYGIVLAFIYLDEGKTVNKGFYIGVAIIMATIVIQMWRLFRNSNSKAEIKVG